MIMSRKQPESDIISHADWWSGYDAGYEAGRRAGFIWGLVDSVLTGFILWSVMR